MEDLLWAIFYESDAYSVTGDKVMGRQAAGNSLLKAYARSNFDKIGAYTRNDINFNDFKNVLSSFLRPDQNKEVSKPVVNDIQKLAEFSKRNNNVDLAGRFVYNKNEIACFNFGKHKGKPVEQVLSEEPSYYSWMMKGEFSINTKKVLENIKLQLLQKKFGE